jgi:hypothetical protein
MTNQNSEYGKKIWSFAGGRIPLRSNGKEPAFTSHDKIAILNTSAKDATITIMILYEGRNPVDKYEIKLKARRVKKIRFNDLIDPLPVPLDTPFGFVLTSDVKVIVEFSRADTSSNYLAAFITTPYFKKNE